MKTFFHCRGRGAIAGQSFTISSCPVGQVIIIRTAEVGHDRTWDEINPQSCSWVTATCRWSVADNAAIMSCNGQRSCTFRGTVFAYTPLCGQENDGNYINIKYDCITGT